MKVLFTSFTYWPNVDGVQNVTCYQAEKLAEYGHDVTVITSMIEGLPKEEVHNSVKIIRVPAYKRALWVKGNKKETQRIFLKEVSKSDVYIMTCLFDYLSQWILPLYNKITCRNYVMMHGTWEYNYTQIDKSSLKKFIRKTIQNIRWKEFFIRYNSVIKKLDGAFHLHKKDESYKYFESKGQKNNYELINAVDENLFSITEKKSNDKTIYLQIANYSFGKNQEMGLKAFYEANLDNAELWFVGSEENDYCKYLKNINKNNIKNNVKFYYGISRNELYKLISKSDIFILSSISEHLPVTLLEGMAAKKPFISTDVGVVKYIPGGIVCKSQKDLVTALKLLYKDKNKRKELSELGYNYAIANCRIDKQVRKMEKVLLKDISK